MRIVLAALLLLGACKESGPSEAQLAVQRRAEQQHLCEQHRPSVRAQWEQLAALAKELKAAPPVERDELPQRALKLRELHFSDELASATTDANYLSDFDGPKRGIIGSCTHRLDECKTDDSWLESALAACATIDTAVLLRRIEEVQPKADPEGRRKYSPGLLRAEVYVYALAGPDGGGPVRLGAFRIETRLIGEVEVYRESTADEIAHALKAGLRTSAWRATEARLAR